MKKILIVLFCVFFNGCFSTSVPFRIADTVDPITNMKSLYSFGNKVQTVSPKELYLDLMVFNAGEAKQEIVISAYYSGTEWVFIEKGKNLTFNADGEIITFPASPLPGSRDVSQYGTVSEHLYYVFDKKKFNKILNSQKVAGRIAGANKTVDFVFTAENQSNLKSLLAML